jgi:predicted nucleic acid-binding Zn ribbon protein
MLGSRRKLPDFAEKAERRARRAVLYLVLITAVLVVMCAAMLWWA